MASSFVQGIHWVSGENKQAKRNARGHLMREMRRKKQWAKEHTDDVPSLPQDRNSVTLVHTPWISTKREEKIVVLPKESSPRQGGKRSPGSSVESSSNQDSPDRNTLHLFHTADSDPASSSADSISSKSSPICPLQSNSDPFSSFPTTPANSTLSQVIFNAIDFKSICAEIWNSKENASFNPLRDVIYPASSQDPAAFGPMVTMIASIQSRYRDLPLDPEALNSKVWSLHTVTERLGQGPDQALCDGTLMAVFGLCMLESHFGDQQSCDAHAKGLYHLILQRGGYDTLHEHMQVLFTVCCMLSYPQSFTLPSMSTSSNPKLAGKESTEPHPAMRTEELVDFLGGVETCIRSPLSVLRKRSETLRARMFLHRAISRSKKKRQGRDPSLRYHRQCQFACLAYVHLLVLENRNTPSALGRELDDIVEQLRGHKAHLGVSSDILVWLLNLSSRSLKLRNSERSHVLSRFMSVIKRLTDTALSELVQYLLDTLEGKSCRRGVMHDLPGHDGVWKTELQ